MTYEEYKVKLYQIRQKHSAEEFALARDYALSNNDVKVGDIIEYFNCKLKVENIKTYISFGVPECVYNGTQLNKDGTVAKRQKQTSIYQSNLDRFRQGGE